MMTCQSLTKSMRRTRKQVCFRNRPPMLVTRSKAQKFASKTPLAASLNKPERLASEYPSSLQVVLAILVMLLVTVHLTQDQTEIRLRACLCRTIHRWSFILLTRRKATILIVHFTSNLTPLIDSGNHPFLRKLTWRSVTHHTARSEQKCSVFASLEFTQHHTSDTGTQRTLL
jgi:hypothetical protein